MKLSMDNSTYKKGRPTLKALFKQAKMPWDFKQSRWSNKVSSVTFIKKEDIVVLVVSSDKNKVLSDFLKTYITSIGGQEIISPLPNIEFDYRIEQEKKYWSESDLTKDEIESQLRAFTKAWEKVRSKNVYK